MSRLVRLMSTCRGHTYDRSTVQAMKTSVQACGRVAVLTQRAQLSFVALSVDEYESLLKAAGEWGIEDET